MDKKEKIIFVEEVMKNLREGILEKMDNVPDVWDGIELREWIADYTAENFIIRRLMQKKTKRYQDYKNDRIMHSL